MYAQKNTLSSMDAPVPQLGVRMQVQNLDKELSVLSDSIRDLYETIKPVCHLAENAQVEKAPSITEPSELGQALETLVCKVSRIRNDVNMIRDRVCL